jgi:hypothetical protein
MTGKSFVIAVSLIGLLVASLAAFVTVALVGFFGIGLIGLLIVFICTQVELEADGVAGGGLTPGMFAQQLKARREMSQEQRALDHEAQSLAANSLRFFKHFGMGLAVIGFGGFAYYQL